MLRFVALPFVIGFAFSAHCAPFANLGFELGSTNSSQVEVRWDPLTFKVLTFGTGPVVDLLPGWAVSLGGQQTNLMAVGSGYYQWPDPLSMPTYAALIGRGEDFNAARPLPIDGNYALSLDNHRRPPGSSAAIVVSQTGDVPSEARFLTLRSYPTYNVGAFALTIGDQRFDIFDFRWEPSDATRFALDISAWAGKTVTLGVSLVFDGAAVIDSIAFVPALDWLLLIEKNPPVSGQPPSVTLIFGVESGHDYFVEFRDSLDAGSSWQALPAAPHNSGSVVDSAAGPQRFYRLRSQVTTP
jgi:hypothetical protein